MTPTNGRCSPAAIRPFIGRRCRVTLACRACGRQHTRAGRLGAAARAGEVLLDTQTYALEDILAIEAQAEPVRPGLPLYWLLPILTFLAGSGAWLRLLRH